jgi:hypothetical protein
MRPHPVALIACGPGNQPDQPTERFVDPAIQQLDVGPGRLPSMSSVSPPAAAAASVASS